jgi:hypothetical protein
MTILKKKKLGLHMLARASHLRYLAGGDKITDQGYPIQKASKTLISTNKPRMVITGMPIIPATREEKNGRFTVQGQPGQKLARFHLSQQVKYAFVFDITIKKEFKG